jgi:SAM-dependent methyltransferase
MCALDLGCGAGDVWFLAAELIGPTGSVVGIDRDPCVLAIARAGPREGLDDRLVRGAVDRRVRCIPGNCAKPYSVLPLPERTQRLDLPFALQLLAVQEHVANLAVK